MKTNAIFSVKLRPVVLALLLAVTLSSCYSVRIVSRDGEPEKKAVSSDAGFYRDKVAHRQDTTITLNPIQSDFSLVDPVCPYGFYSVEYRVSLGQALLNMITFGKVKKVKIIYVCNKDC